MTHSVRCERARGPICKCRCEGSKHGTALVAHIMPSGTPTPITGRYLSIPMGGTVAKALKQYYNKTFTCTCGHTVRISKFLGHPDGIGYPDRKKTRWQIYVKCPSCAHDWPIWEIAIRRSITLIPESERVHFAVERYLEEFETMWPTPQDMPRFEIQEEKECFLLIDRECYTSRGAESEITVCGGFIGVLSHCIEWVGGHNQRIERIEYTVLESPADVFRIEKVKR